jgi:hypothetical protein
VGFEGAVLTLRRFFTRLKGRWGPAFQSDTAFVESAFREILGRNADLDGLNHYRRVLREGLGRTAVLLDIMRSEEFVSKLEKPEPGLPSLRALRPDRYRGAIDRTNGQSITVFDVSSEADFDWLEDAIVKFGYYEKPGVWTLGVDADKIAIAEIIASFSPRRAIELGCAAGAVLECLEDRGVSAEGIEISAMAREKASPRVRGRIHHGDLLTLNLPAAYDVLFGLDVFEHLNPNRLDDYLTRLASIATSDAFLFCNVPAFGEDSVFGTVFPLYVDGWERDAAAGRPFRTVHVDDLGYPIHGHLTWADARWWSGRFEAAGFRRDVEIERALHAKYDAYMEKRAPARKAYFVFTMGASHDRRASVMKRIQSTPSHAFR